MKTQIIQLEPHDDVISVRDKMTWGQTQRILLIWPDKNGTLLNRRLDLVLLQRRCDDLGAQLGLITKDPEVVFHAMELQIPLFKNTKEAQTQRWRRRRRKSRIAFRRVYLIDRERPSAEEIYQTREKLHPTTPPWTEHIAARLVFFSLGILALFAIGAIILPGAQIHLFPKTRPQEVTFNALTGPSITTVNLSGAVPTREITVVVEGRHTTEASGEIAVPNIPATGRVKFTNLTNKSIVIPEGTVVRTLTQPPIRFKTTRPDALPQGIGESINLPVLAIDPGKSGNVPAGSILSTDGILGLDLSVVNPLPASGGGDTMMSAPTALDRQRAYSELVESLRNAALSEIGQSMEADDILLTARPFLSSVIEKSYLPEKQVPSDQIEVSLRLEFKAQIVSGEDLRSLADLVLNTSLQSGFTPLEGTTTFTLASEPVLDDGEIASWKITAMRMIRYQPQKDRIVRQILGLTPQLAFAQIRQERQWAQPPEIRLTPEWWPRLPVLPFRIQVIVEPLPGKEP